jgi:cytochrome P450
MQDTRQKIVKVKARIDAGEKSTRPTIFKQLLDPNATEGHMVPDVDQLTDDAFIIPAAAADTTRNAMTIATYNVLSNPSIHSKLKCELKEAFPDGNARLDFVTLEKLPYLVRYFKSCSAI